MPSSHVVRWAGSSVIIAAAVASFALALWLPTLSGVAGLALVGALVGIPAAVWVGTRHPLVPLAALGVFFGFVSRNKAGIQVEEVVFAGYYLGYLVAWYGLRLFVYRERIARTPVDLALLAFLAYMTASVGLTFLFGGSLSGALSEWITFSMFALYFPVREATERYPVGPWLVPSIVLFLGLYASVRNLSMVREGLLLADHARAVTGGRVPMNEMVVLAASLGCFAVAASARRWWVALVAAPVGALTVGALVMSQSRAYYVDLAVGLLVLLALLARGPRLRLVVIGTLTAVLGAAALVLVAGDLVLLLAHGLLDRLLSIGTATSVDISLINRFVETRAAWESVKANPVLGYGLGVPFTFFDAIYKANWTKAYVHNGYLMLWYKFGLFGLLAVLAVWLRGIVHGLRVRYAAGALPWNRTLGLWAAATLISLIPSHASSATFSTSDTVLIFTLLLGMVAGLHSATAHGGARDETREG